MRFRIPGIVMDHTVWLRRLCNVTISASGTWEGVRRAFFWPDRVLMHSLCHLSDLLFVRIFQCDFR